MAIDHAEKVLAARTAHANDPALPVEASGAARREAIQATHDLASILSAAGRFDEADSKFRLAVEKGRELLNWGSAPGHDHPDLLIWQNDWACNYFRWAAALSGEQSQSLLPPLARRSWSRRG